MERRLNLLTFLYFLTITERGVALSTSTATAYEYNVAGHLSFGAPNCEKAQKSSGFWANRTYRLCIKDNVLIELKRFIYKLNCGLDRAERVKLLPPLHLWELLTIKIYHLTSGFTSLCD